MIKILPRRGNGAITDILYTTLAETSDLKIEERNVIPESDILYSAETQISDPANEQQSVTSRSDTQYKRTCNTIAENVRRSVGLEARQSFVL